MVELKLNEEVELTRNWNYAKVVDAHCHLYEFSDDELGAYCNSLHLIIVSVSDDYTSSLRTLDIAVRCRNVIPAIGVHPWVLNRVDAEREVELISTLVSKVRLLGEVGIDRRFVPETYDKQLEVFRKFLGIARDLNLGVNVHAAGAWGEVLNLLSRYDIKVAIIHWYTGPVELLKHIEDMGYYITVNPAVKIQERLREVVRKAPIEIVLTESDGPYTYRGLRLTPAEVLTTINELAMIKGLNNKEVTEAIYRNFSRLANNLGLKGY